jgi:hypothetical protein
MAKAAEALQPAAGMLFSQETFFLDLQVSFRTVCRRILQATAIPLRHGYQRSREDEVDVLAKKGNEHFIMDCKYHSEGGKPADVKVALYIHSRFNDIKKALELSPEHGQAVHQGWLVTTRCTTDAIQYAECVNHGS